MKELQKIKKLIYSSDIQQSMELAASLIRDINSSDYYDINVTDIEKELINKAFKSNKLSCKNHDAIKEDIIFVISEGYITGGHTRLMENLSQMILSKRILLITKPTDVKVMKRFKDYFEIIITCFQDSDSLEYVYKIAKELIKYNKVILNTHPDDIYTIVACGIAKKVNKDLRVYFVNHADHIATYGVTVSDFWFELSICGQKLDKGRGISAETKTSFLGIPIKKPVELLSEKVTYNYSEDGNKFLSAASSNKYEVVSNTSIAPLLEKILTMNLKNEVSIIGSGVSDNYAFDKIKKKYPKRLKFYSSLPYDEYIELSKDTDFYIDSFPMPGGTAFVEQFMQGKPCLGLHTNFYGYTPLELVKQNTVAEALDLLTNPPTENFINELHLKISEVHSFEKVKERFFSSLYDNHVFINPMTTYMKEKRVIKNNKFYFSRSMLNQVYNLDKLVFFKLIISKKNFERILVKIYKIINKKFI